MSRGATASLLTLPNEAIEDWWKHSGTPECVPALNCLNHDLLQQFCSTDFAPFFSQGLICSNSKGLMHSAKQPEIALYGATNSSVSSQLLPTVVSCVIPAGRRYCKNLLTPHRRSKFPETFLKLTRLDFLA